MLIFFLILIIIIFLIFIILFNLIISKKINKNYEKIIPFECGFDAFSSFRVPFCLHFYLITVIFLLFDIEISLIIPIICKINLFFFEFYYFIILIFFTLLLGLLIEWKEGSLNWSI